MRHGLGLLVAASQQTLVAKCNCTLQFQLGLLKLNDHTWIRILQKAQVMG
jgi:hypothetical protein